MFVVNQHVFVVSSYSYQHILLSIQKKELTSNFSECYFSPGLGHPSEDSPDGLHQEPEPRGVGSEGSRGCEEAGQVCVQKNFLIFLFVENELFRCDRVCHGFRQA